MRLYNLFFVLLFSFCGQMQDVNCATHESNNNDTDDDPNLVRAAYTQLETLASDQVQLALGHELPLLEGQDSYHDQSKLIASLVQILRETLTVKLNAGDHHHLLSPHKALAIQRLKDWPPLIGADCNAQEELALRKLSADLKLLASGSSSSMSSLDQQQNQQGQEDTANIELPHKTMQLLLRKTLELHAKLCFNTFKFSFVNLFVAQTRDNNFRDLWSLLRAYKDEQPKVAWKLLKQIAPDALIRWQAEFGKADARLKQIYAESVTARINNFLSAFEEFFSRHKMDIETINGLTTTTGSTLDVREMKNVALNFERAAKLVEQNEQITSQLIQYVHLNEALVDSTLEELLTKVSHANSGTNLISSAEIEALIKMILVAPYSDTEPHPHQPDLLLPNDWHWVFKKLRKEQDQVDQKYSSRFWSEADKQALKDRLDAYLSLELVAHRLAYPARLACDKEEADVMRRVSDLSTLSTVSTPALSTSPLSAATIVATANAERRKSLLDSNCNTFFVGFLKMHASSCLPKHKFRIEALSKEIYVFKRLSESLGDASQSSILGYLKSLVPSLSEQQQQTSSDSQPNLQVKVDEAYDLFVLRPARRFIDRTRAVLDAAEQDVTLADFISEQVVTQFKQFAVFVLFAENLLNSSPPKV